MSLGRFFAYPLRGQGGLLLLVCAVGLYLLLAAFDWSRAYPVAHLLITVFLPVPAILALGVFQHYTWASLRQVAAGHTEPIRSIEIEEVSPLANFLAFKVALLLLGVGGALAACFSASVVLGTAVAAAVGVLLPAALGVMVLDERFLPGLDPKRVARFAVDLDMAYVAFALAIYSGMASLYVVCFVVSPPSIAAVLVASYLFVLAHVAAGRVLYVCRDRLDLATLTELDSKAVAEQAVADEIDKLMVDLHRHCAVDRVNRANGLLEGFLRENDYALDERIHQRLEVFHDKRLLLEHGWHYLNRLLAANKVTRGWLLLRESLDVDPLFRPGTAEATLTLITAAPPADAKYVDILLGDFERAYPGSERLPEAIFEHARWLVTQLGSTDHAFELLLRIEREFPEWAQDAQFRSFIERVRRHAKVRSVRHAPHARHRTPGALR